MPKYEVVGIREETEAERKMRETFDQMAVESPRALEDAARLIVGLVTGLYGLLFGVLAVAGDPVPAYLRIAAVRLAGIAAVVLLLFSLLAAIVVVLPRRWSANPAKPEAQAAEFRRLLDYKSRALTVAAVSFGLGLIALASVLALALMSAGR